MALPTEDLLRLLRNGGSLRVAASQHSEVDLHHLAQNTSAKATLHIVMDRTPRIEDLVQIASAAKGSVLFDWA